MSHRASLESIASGSAEDFVAALCREIESHSAIDHPYLHALARGNLPDVGRALCDYVEQYGHYSEAFPRYLEAVIERIQQPAWVAPLLENLDEERGDPEADDPEELPHSVLFERFQSAIGAEDNEAAPCPTALAWRDQFLTLCQADHPGVGIGALGLATEMIVPKIYRFLLEGIRKHTDLLESDYLFFTLHVECDERHGQAMRELATQVATSQEAREALHYGVHSALALRAAFWDTLQSRANAMTAG